MRAFVRFLPLPALSLLAACSGSTTAGSSAPAPAAAPKAFEYTPSTSQYRFTQSAKITQSMMGQSQDAESSGSQLITVTVTRASADTLALAIVIDSIALVGPMGMTPPGVDKVVGAKYSARTSPGGVVYSATGPSEAESTLGAQLTQEVTRILPRIRAVLSFGVSWTDTLTDKPKQNGMELDRQVISHYQVLGDSTVGGQLAWKIARDNVTTASGAGSPQGQQVTLSTKATGKGIFLVSKRGVLLGGESTETSDGMATLVANSMQIGLKQSTTTKMTKVK